MKLQTLAFATLTLAIAAPNSFAQLGGSSKPSASAGVGTSASASAAVGAQARSQGKTPMSRVPIDPGVETLSLQGAFLYGRGYELPLNLRPGILDVQVLARRDLVLEFTGPMSRIERFVLRASASVRTIRLRIDRRGVHALLIKPLRQARLIHPILRARPDGFDFLLEARKKDGIAARTANVRGMQVRENDFLHSTHIVDRPQGGLTANPASSAAGKNGAKKPGGTGKTGGKGGASGKV